MELLFTLAFAFWTYFKAHNPEITTAGGEKWMEMAFINSSLLSPSFPPQDPWLAGFGISYYYFGYILMAMLIRLSGVASTTAFNLLIPTLLGLTLSAALSIVTNLVCVHRKQTQPTLLASLTGLLGAVFVALLGHWEGLLEVLHSRGLLSSLFWRWLDIMNLNEPPLADGPWIPQRFIWWWRGSRVINDYDLAGVQREVIDEMPFFSFLLGDVHPHVMNLPFVLLAIALAFNLVLNLRLNNQATEGEDNPSLLETIKNGIRDLVLAAGGRLPYVLYALCIGALGFLNTWDLPIYLAVMGLAYWLWRGRENIVEAVAGMGAFAVVAILLYLPFYLSFQSQAGGILPNLWNPTRLPQFVVFFGPFLVLGIGLVMTCSQGGKSWQKNLKWTLPLFLVAPLLLLIMIGAAFFILPGPQEFLQGYLNDPNIQTALGGGNLSHLLTEILKRRLGNPWTYLFLGGLLSWVFALWWANLSSPGGRDGLNKAEQFALSLLFVGFLLSFSTEVFFLKDLFKTRMNTIFKFYFQAWVLLALVGAFGVYYVHQTLRKPAYRMTWQVGVVVMVLAALVYPSLAILNKTNNFTGPANLDGTAWVANYSPDDYAAIQWLKENADPTAVILEAPGDSYKFDNRASALSGRATVLGWRFHQAQWRGSYEENSKREPDIERIFNDTNPAITLPS